MKRFNVRLVLSFAILSVFVVLFQNCGEFSALQASSGALESLPADVLNTEPVEVLNAKGSIAAAVDGGHACAVLDGALQCWGSNTYGQLGDGTKINSAKPKIIFSSGVTAVTAGAGHTCAIVNGSLNCWGQNNYGQVGEGAKEIVSPLVVIPSGVTMVSAGRRHTCAVVNDELKCWGHNSAGQLGNGIFDDSPIPVSVLIRKGVQAVSAGSESTCAIVNNGTLKCWGANKAGQLGIGSTESSSVPVVVMSGGVRSVLSPTPYANCAIVTGALKCWGDLTLIDYSDSRRTLELSPKTFVTGDVQAAAISATQLCVVISGALRCWENASYLSNSSGVQYSLKTVEIASSGVSEISLSNVFGNYFGCARVNGAPSCWGSNQDGRLGRGYFSDPVPLSKNIGLTNVEKISLGRFQTCALTADGAVKCAGIEFDLAPGESTKTVIASGATDVTLNEGYGGCAIVSSTLRCWDRTVESGAVKTVIDSGVMEFKWAGDNAGLALKSDGSVWSFSKAYNGDGTYRFGVPTQSIASGAVAIEVSFFNSVVLKSDGQVLVSKSNGPFALWMGGVEKIFLFSYRLCVVLTDHVTVKCGYLINTPADMRTVYTGAISRAMEVRSSIWILTPAGALVDDAGKTIFASGVTGEAMDIYDSESLSYKTCVIVNNERRCWSVTGAPSDAVTTAAAVQEQYGGYNVCVLHLDNSVSCGGGNEFGESDPLLIQKDATLLPVSGP